MSDIDTGQSYFELFRLPEAFSIDTSDLQLRYRQLQRTVHPDRHVNADPAQRRRSLEQSAFVNEAYQSLMHPVSRARYLLRRRGSQINLDNHATDAGFLMEQMELREELASIAVSDDADVALGAFVLRLQQLIQCYGDNFAGQLNAGNEVPAATAVAKMQFISKLLDEADRLEADLLDD